eukprot:g37785.t1
MDPELLQILLPLLKGDGALPLLIALVMPGRCLLNSYLLEKYEPPQKSSKEQDGLVIQSLVDNLLPRLQSLVDNLLPRLQMLRGVERGSATQQARNIALAGTQGTSRCTKASGKTA